MCEIMCLKFRKSKKEDVRRAEAELAAKERAIRDEVATQRKQVAAEAKERSRRYPCTGGAEVITARPIGMDYETYREVRARQQKQIRAYLKHGRMVYKAAEIYIVRGDGSELPYTKDNADNGTVMRRTWPPYRRPKLLTANDQRYGEEK